MLETAIVGAVFMAGAAPNNARNPINPEARRAAAHRLRTLCQPGAEGGGYHISLGAGDADPSIVAANFVFECEAHKIHEKLCVQRRVWQVAIVLPGGNLQFGHEPSIDDGKVWPIFADGTCGPMMDEFAVEGEVPLDIAALLSEQRDALHDAAGLKPAYGRDGLLRNSELSTLMPYFSEHGSGKYCAGYRAADDGETFICFKKEGDRLVPFDAQGKP